MNIRAMALVALVLVLLVAAFLLGRRDSFVSEHPAKTIAPGLPAAGTPPASGSGLSGQAAGTPPPWAAGAVVVPMPAQAGNLINGLPSPSASAATIPSDPKALEIMQRELAASMQAGQQPDPKRVEALLNEVKRQHGPIVAGVNLDVVIKNLQVAEELQKLALEIKRESEKPGGGDSKKMQANMQQLTQLQSQLHTDISMPTKPASTK